MMLLKKRILAVLSFSLMFASVFGSINVGAQEKNTCPDGACLTVPSSNVTDEEFDNILSRVLRTEEFQALAEETIIGSLGKDDIIIIENDGVASVNFVIGENVQEDNLANVEILYLVEEDIIYAKKLLYGEVMDNGLLNVRMVVNDLEAFSMNLDEQGNIIEEETGEIISQTEFYEMAVEEMNSDTDIANYSWCEWAVGALCGTGGGVACYGLALALGITGGIAGLGLATVCSLIGSLGCIGATKAICG